MAFRGSTFKGRRRFESIGQTERWSGNIKALYDAVEPGWWVSIGCGALNGIGSRSGSFWISWVQMQWSKPSRFLDFLNYTTQNPDITWIQIQNPEFSIWIFWVYVCFIFFSIQTCLTTSGFSVFLDLHTQNPNPDLNQFPIQNVDPELSGLFGCASRKWPFRFFLYELHNIDHTTMPSSNTTWISSCSNFRSKTNMTFRILIYIDYWVYGCFRNLNKKRKGKGRKFYSNALSTDAS